MAADSSLTGCTRPDCTVTCGSGAFRLLAVIVRIGLHPQMSAKISLARVKVIPTSECNNGSAGDNGSALQAPASRRCHITDDGPDISLPDTVPGLSIYRLTESSTNFYGVYEPSVCFVLNGSKLVSPGGDVIQYAENCYLISAIGMPMSGWAQSASSTDPYIAMLLCLDLQLIRRLIVEYDMNGEAMRAIEGEQQDRAKLFPRLVTRTSSPSHAEASDLMEWLFSRIQIVALVNMDIIDKEI